MAAHAQAVFPLRAERDMTGYDVEFSRGVRLRVGICAVAVLLGLGVVMARAVQLQVLQGDKLGSMARDQWIRQIELTPRRGPIVDAVGVPLAVSIESDSFFLDPSIAEGLPVKELAAALQVERSFLVAKMNEKRSFTWLVRRAGPAISDAVRALKNSKELDADARRALRAVGTVGEYSRFYPQKHVASHVLGLVGMDDRGLEGLELEFDALLKGESQARSALRDVRGNRLLTEPAVPSAALVGAKVQLSIDSALQHAAEESLARGVATAKARSGVAIVIEPDTGAILAMATWPRFNANARASAAERRNRVVTDAWEPGSTLKCFTWAAALADGLATPQTPIEVGDGKLRFGRTTIGDSHRPDAPVMTATQALAQSSNVAIAKMALAMGPERLVWWLERFGFGSRTDLNLPGEARGRLQNPARMGDIGTATTSFGQGMTATPLQMAMALGAIANGGRLMKPVLVRRVSAADGTVLLDAKPELVRQLLSPEIAQAVARMMVAVTERGGTGTRAAIAGVEVSGKTGTAQKVDPIAGGYSKGKRFGSFMGFAPANAPRVAVFVGIDEPMGDSTYGGVVAAPIFREITEEALRRMGVATDTTGQAIEKARLERQSSGATVDSLSRFVEGFVDDGDEELAALKALPDSGLRVPDVRGKSARVAWRSLAQKGFEVEIQGTGLVVAQKPAAGGAGFLGDTVSLTLEVAP